MNASNNAQPTEDELRRASVRPGFELPSTVTKLRSVVMTRGLQPEDLGVLDYLKLRDPSLPSTKEDLAREMQTLGWKMGKTRFDAIFLRLKAAGHIKHHAPYNPATGRPEWVIEFYMEPGNNDQYVNSGISAFSQVGAETPETGVPQIERTFETPETSISRGQKGSQVSRDSEGKPWKPAFPSGAVLAGQSRNPENQVFGSPPPHPPGGEVNTSPHPLTAKRGPVGAATPRGGKEVDASRFTSEQLEKAVEFLRHLRPPFYCGRPTAERLAPLLLAAIEENGWELGDELAAWLTKNSEGIVRGTAALEKKRIPELPLYEVVRSNRARPRTAAAPAAVECGRGCDEGWLMLEDGMKPCECMPQRAAAV